MPVANFKAAPVSVTVEPLPDKTAVAPRSMLPLFGRASPGDPFAVIVPEKVGLLTTFSVPLPVIGLLGEAERFVPAAIDVTVPLPAEVHDGSALAPLLVSTCPAVPGASQVGAGWA